MSQPMHSPSPIKQFQSHGNKSSRSQLGLNWTEQEVLEQGISLLFCWMVVKNGLDQWCIAGNNIGVSLTSLLCISLLKGMVSNQRGRWKLATDLTWVYFVRWWVSMLSGHWRWPLSFEPGNVAIDTLNEYLDVFYGGLWNIWMHLYKLSS
jgi:hypothetical protein